MLPVNSVRYQQFSNFTLLIRKVGEKDTGTYTCQAFNGIGSVSVWDVNLQIDFNPVIGESGHGESGQGHGQHTPGHGHHGGHGGRQDYPDYRQPNAITTTQFPHGTNC